MEEECLFLSMMFGAAACFALEIECEKVSKSNKRVSRVRRTKWVRDWVMRRHEGGCYLNLLKELKVEDFASFKNFMRMSLEDFNHLLNLIAPQITKQDTCMRKAITAGEKLALTLRYLATGETFSSLQYMFRIPKNTISNFIIDVCEAIYEALKGEHLTVPSAESEWLEVARGFNDSWQFPHCIGAIDGKHIVMKAPAHGGSVYYNYKGTHSTVLMGISDANYREKVSKSNKRVSRVRRTKWVRDWVMRRHEGGCYLNLLKELKVEDFASFKNFMRMSLEDFNHLLNLIAPQITKQDTCMRKAITAGEKLALTLRYLATGETFSSLQYMFRIPKNTISNFIIDVCEAIYEALKGEHLTVPSAESEWLEVARGFNDSWQFPHCIGAIDGKHIVMKAPAHGGSVYYNYKGTHSTVLMGISDANYRFLYIDVGANGRISDGGVFRNCSFYRTMIENKLQIPPPCALPDRDILMPYFLCGDDAFAFGTHLMKPFAQKNLSAIQRIFNYRLSRARRIIENAFGILSAKFQVFRKPLLLSPNKCRVITKTACALHNFLIDRNQTSRYIQPGLADQYDCNGTLVAGSWRQDVPEEGFYSMQQQWDAPASKEALRNELAMYFVHEGEVPFQYAHI